MRDINKYQVPQLPALIAFLCACVMLTALPLVFRDAFFDINRVKVELVRGVAPAMCLTSLLCCVAAKQRMPRCRDARGVLAALACFLAACLISAARQGFSPAVLEGSEGRCSGLLFLLSCGAASLAIALGCLRGQISAALACLAVVLVALLGVLNAFGVDPLRFYEGIKQGQENQFLSTIGNLDFFGGYVAMMCPLLAGQSICAGRKSAAAIYALGTIAAQAGVAASGSDGAFLALQLGFAALAALSGDDLARLSRTLLLWALSFAALPVMFRLLLARGQEGLYTGLYLALRESGAAVCSCAVLAAAAVLCRRLYAKGVHAPGRQRMLAVLAVLLVLALIIGCAAIAYFTLVDPECELGALSAYLRFDDNWGTRRGFVYKRSVRALADYSPLDWLFGRGVDNARSILTPYFDDPAMLRYGVFNDAHCQPLQYLLTTGLFGALSLLALHALTLRACWRRAGDSALMTGVCAAFAAYTAVALVSAAQPILMVTYLSLAALAVSAMLHSAKEEGNT